MADPRFVVDIVKVALKYELRNLKKEKEKNRQKTFRQQRSACCFFLEVKSFLFLSRYADLLLTVNDA